MKRSAILKFFILIVLLLAGGSDALSQKLTKFRIEEGRRESWTIKLNTLCLNRSHLYRVVNSYGFITAAQQTDSILVGIGVIGKITLTIDTTGLDSGVRSGTIVVECLDCGKNKTKKSKTYTFEITTTPKTSPVLASVSTPKPVETPAPQPLPTTAPMAEPTPTEITKPVETPAPTEEPAPNEEPTSEDEPMMPDETFPFTKTTPKSCPINLPETPAETTDLTFANTFLAETNSPRDATPTTETSPTPNAETETIPENPAAIETVNVDNFNYIALIAVLLPAILLGSFVGKKIFVKRKYGANAANLKALKEARAIKEELSSKWLKKRKSQNIHAIGVGKIDGTENYCIQLFVENANGEMPDDPPIDLLPERFRKYPIVIYEMPRAGFMSENYSRAREAHDTIIGGISGANANLANEYGTIGYFCEPTFLRPIRKFRREIYLLSNSHVFANLSANGAKREKDFIQQPSPGEFKKYNLVASLENFVPIKFDNDTDDPNYADAAIARLFPNKRHKLEIPVIGKINDLVPKSRVALRQSCRKFGRTTGYTEGKIFSIHLSIWIRYSATGQESFFKEQFLIVPTGAHEDFIRGGDSGSLLADDTNNALGLIFAGAGSDTNFGIENLDPESLLASVTTEKIRTYAVANPISEVMKTLNVKLMK